MHQQGRHVPPRPPNEPYKVKRWPDRSPKKVNCQELLEQLSEYLDEDARQDLCREIEVHLERCQDCKIVVDKTRKTIFLYQADHQIELKGLGAAQAKLSAALTRAYGDSNPTSD